MSFKKIPNTSLVNTILENPFPQTFLMGTSEFLSFLEKRGIRIRDADLERFEAQGLLYPIVRIVRPTVQWKKIKKVENGITKDYLQPLKKGEIFDGETVERYAAIGGGDVTHDLYDYLQDGLLVFPSKSNFKPWKEYKDGRETTVLPFYHPYQAFCVTEILSTVRLTLDGITELENDELLKRIEFLKKVVESGRKSLVNRLKEYEKLTRLLFSVQDRYLPFIRKKFVGKGGIDFYDYWNKWFVWTKKFDPQTIFRESGFTVEQIKKIRLRFAAQAGFIDPLKRWYILVHHIPYSIRKDLRGDALLAQDYYEIADMLGHFLTDLTGEKQVDSDDLLDGLRGRWKKHWYGRDVDYKSREVLQKVLTEYGINPQDRVLLIVEGPTECEAIPKIAEAMGFHFDQLGIRFFPLGGVGEVAPKRIEKLLEYLTFNITTPYVILDNDQNVVRNLKRLKDLIPPNNYRIWKKEFEEDNFSDEEVLQQVIQQAKERGFDLKISPELIEQERQAKQREGKPIPYLTKILEKLTKPFGYKIDKPELGKALGKILSERITNQKDYTPTTEIEREILKIVELARRF